MELWLHLRRLCDGEPGQVVDAIGLGRRLDLLDAGDFVVAGRNDQLAQRLVRHTMLAAIVVEPVAALDACGGLEAALRVVEPAMDDLAVARGRLKTDRIGLFEDDDLFAGKRQGPRRGKP